MHAESACLTGWFYDRPHRTLPRGCRIDGSRANSTKTVRASVVKTAGLVPVATALAAARGAGGREVGLDRGAELGEPLGGGGLAAHDQGGLGVGRADQAPAAGEPGADAIDVDH